MGILNTIFGMLDIYENTRKTDSDKEKSKPEQRNYSFESDFTGDRKLDCPRYKPSKKKKNVSKDDKER